jgi:hypothetical protein
MRCQGFAFAAGRPHAPDAMVANLFAWTSRRRRVISRIARQLFKAEATCRPVEKRTCIARGSKDAIPPTNA